MINTSIHNITGIELMPVKQGTLDGAPYYTQSMEIGTARNGYITVDLYADTAEALINTTEADYWRARAIKADERAVRAETELARIRLGIDQLTGGGAS